MRLFTNDLSANLVLAYGTLQGFVYWANLFYVPIYLQNVRGYGPIISGAVIVPMLVSHGVGSIISGQIISRTGHYNLVILPGNLVWVLGASLQTLYTRTTPVYAICLIGFLQGIGIGFVFQCEIPFCYARHTNQLFKQRTFQTTDSSLYSEFSISPGPLPQGRPSRYKFSSKLLAYNGWFSGFDRCVSHLAPKHPSSTPAHQSFHTSPE